MRISATIPMVKVKGWERLKRRLERIPKAVRKAAQPAVTAAAGDVAATIRILAPVDEGDLRDSVAVTPGGERTPAHSQPGGSVTVPENAALVTAGNSKVRYAHLVEYGSAAHIAGGIFKGAVIPAIEPKPFFWPGFKLSRKRAARKIKRGITKAVRDTKNGN